MSILDELKAQAEKKSLALEGFANRQQKQESEFVNEILPKLQFIYTYFKEILDYLSVIETPIQVANYCPMLPALGALQQYDYRLTTDEHGGIADFAKLNEVNLLFKLKASGKLKGRNHEELVYLKENKMDVEKERRMLTKNNIPFSFSRSLKAHQQEAGIFKVKRNISAAFRFIADTENARIVFKVINHENFESSEQYLTPAQITQEFLDKIAGYLLRKESQSSTQKIDDASREAIRQKLAAEKAEKDRQLQLAEEKARLEKEAQEKQKLGYKIKSFFKKKNSK